MRLIVTLSFILINSMLFSQAFYEIVENGKAYYTIEYQEKVSSKTIFPDGRYVVDPSWGNCPFRSCAFHVKDNMIHGPVSCRTDTGYYYGNYYMDSLWTLFTDIQNPKFRSGNWQFLDYSLGFAILDTIIEYAIPYNENGIYEDIYCLLDGGDTVRNVTYTEGLGFTSEKYYNIETGKLHTYVEHTPIYSKTERYRNDSIIYIELVYDSLAYFIRSETGNKYYHGADWVAGIRNIKSIKRNGFEEIVVKSNVDATKTYEDEENGTNLSYDCEGNIILEYRTKRGRWKDRKIRR